MGEEQENIMQQLRLWFINRTATIRSIFQKIFSSLYIKKKLFSLWKWFDIMVTSSDSLHTTSSFDLFDNIKKCHIYDAMSSKSAHLSISQKSPQYNFWHVCHQYFISKPRGLFCLNFTLAFSKPPKVKRSLVSRTFFLRESTQTSETNCITYCEKTLIFLVCWFQRGKMVSVTGTTCVYWQVNALALSCEALSQFCGYAKQLCACALGSTAALHLQVF